MNTNARQNTLRHGNSVSSSWVFINGYAGTEKLAAIAQKQVRILVGSEVAWLQILRSIILEQ